MPTMCISEVDLDLTERVLLQKGDTTVVISSIAAGEQMVNVVQMRVVN